MFVLWGFIDFWRGGCWTNPPQNDDHSVGFSEGSDLRDIEFEHNEDLFWVYRYEGVGLGGGPGGVPNVSGVIIWGLWI